MVIELKKIVFNEVVHELLEPIKNILPGGLKYTINKVKDEVYPEFESKIGNDLVFGTEFFLDTNTKKQLSSIFKLTPHHNCVQLLYDSWKKRTPEAYHDFDLFKKNLLTFLDIFFQKLGENWTPAEKPAWEMTYHRLEDQVQSLNFDLTEPFLNDSDFLTKMNIQDINIWKLFKGNQGLNTSKIKANYNDKWIKYPTIINRFFKKYIKSRKKIAKVRGQTFDNNKSYSLKRIDVERPQNKKGERVNYYTLQLYPSDFEHFVYPNLCLEDKQNNPDTNRDEKIREIVGLQREKLSIDNLENLPFHFKVGVGTIFITNDNFVIGTIRSSRQLIVPPDDNWVEIHLSGAEGMLRPIDQFNGSPTPFRTSVRSIEDELGIIEDDDFNASNIRCIGIFFDTLRAQPFFLFYFKSQKVCLSDVFENWFESKDKHENSLILGMPWILNNILQIFFEPKLDDVKIYILPEKEKDNFFKLNIGKSVRFASNHAQVGYAIALMNDFKKTEIEKAIALVKKKKH